MSLRLATPPRASDDDPRDLDHLYRTHYGLVLKLCLRMSGGRRPWAEDVAQDVFLQLHRKPEVLREVDNVQAWLTTVTTRRCLARLRRDSFLQAAPVRWMLRHDAPPVPTPETQGILDDTLKKAADVVQAQPPKVRAAFFLYYVDQMTVSEIGAVLGHRKSYVSKLLKRAREAVEKEDLR